MKKLILAVNPGSTSTKAALYEDRTLLKECNVPHRKEDLGGCSDLFDQIPLRMTAVDKLLYAAELGDRSLDAVIGRGGLMRPLEGGVYRVNEAMLADLGSCRFGTHASNLGAAMARELAKAYGGGDCPALIADPVVVDELMPEARVSGLPGMERRSIFHALNQKSVAREAAMGLDKLYEETNLIVAHMGGGISIGAHKKGRVVDVNNALDGDGPFSPERSGTLPAGQLLDLVDKGIPTADIRKMLTGQGGLEALKGTKDLRDIIGAMDEGDTEAEQIYGALVLQLSQEIAKHGATLEGVVDGVVLTGGLANSGRFTDDIKKRISYLAPVVIIPGEREMQSLAENALAALSGERRIKEY